MHRSGTSALAGVLRLLGARAPKTLMPALPNNNEKGFFESVPVARAHDDFLSSVGARWDDPMGVADGALRSAEGGQLGRRLDEIVRDEFGDARLFVVKDPRMSWLVPVWSAVFARLRVDARYLICLRQPSEVAASLAKRDNLGPAHATLLWLSHTHEAERATRNEKRSFVAYEDLLADWRAETGRIARELGCAWPRNDKAAHREIRRFLSADLRHHRHHQANSGELPQLGQWAARTYEIMTDAARGKELDTAGLEAVAQELAMARSSFGAVVNDVFNVHLRSSEQLQSVRRQLQEAESQNRAALAAAVTEEQQRTESRYRAALATALTKERQHVERRFRAELATALTKERQQVETRYRAELAVALTNEQELRAVVDALRVKAEGSERRCGAVEAELIQANQLLAKVSDELSRSQRAAEETIQYQAGALRRQQLAIDDLTRRFEAVVTEFWAVLGSRAWRVTEPVRVAGRLVGRAKRAARRQAVEFDGNVRRADGGSWAAIDANSKAGTMRIVPASGFFAAGWVRVEGELVGVDGRTPAPGSSLDIYGAPAASGSTVRLRCTQQGKIDDVVLLPERVTAINLDLGSTGESFQLKRLRLQEIGDVEALWVKHLGDEPSRHGGDSRWGRLVSRTVAVARDEGLKGLVAKLHGRKSDVPEQSYERWVADYDQLSHEDRERIRRRIDSFKYKPRISVLMPTYDTPEAYLRRAVATVQEQLYPNWELCIADDCSPKSRVRVVLEELATKDERIKVVYREKNGHISAATNSALSLAAGEFIALLDHDDELAPHALYMVVEELNAHRKAGLVYSDEDKIDDDGRRYDPYFKSGWNPDLFLSHNMVSHLGVYRKALVDEVGGFREGFEGSQDYDLALRVVEHLSPDQIRHIPHVLYHWRAVAGSTAHAAEEKPYAYTAGTRAIEEHLGRRGVSAKVEPAHRGSVFYRVRYALPRSQPKVSIIIPTRDRLDLLRRCVDGIRDGTDYRALEVIIVDNQSTNEETLGYLENLEERGGAVVLRYEEPFNFSAINNAAARRASGEVLVFLNNDIEILSRQWLQEMVSHAIRPEVGAVGALLYYPDDTIQHAGVVLGIGGVGNHAHLRMPRGADGYFGRARLIQNFAAVTAACMAVRREVFAAVDGFDERLRVAFNDVDFCVRLLKAGYWNVFTPYAELRHHESASRGSDFSAENHDRFMAENREMENRWGPLLKNDPFYNPNLTLTAEDFSLAFPPRACKPWLAENSRPPRRRTAGRKRAT
jgi:O-antigen biosynthesis protein